MISKFVHKKYAESTFFSLKPKESTETDVDCKKFQFNNHNL